MDYIIDTNENNTHYINFLKLIGRINIFKTNYHTDLLFKLQFVYFLWH